MWLSSLVSLTSASLNFYSACIRTILGVTPFSQGLIQRAALLLLWKVGVSFSPWSEIPRCACPLTAPLGYMPPVAQQVQESSSGTKEDTHTSNHRITDLSPGAPSSVRRIGFKTAKKPLCLGFALTPLGRQDLTSLPCSLEEQVPANLLQSLNQSLPLSNSCVRGLWHSLGGRGVMEQLCALGSSNT